MHLRLKYKAIFARALNILKLYIYIMEVIKKIFYGFVSEDSVKWYVLGCIIVIFAFLIYPDLIATKNIYKLGDVVKRDVKASKNFFIENQKATRGNKKKAEEKVPTVYDFDITFAPKLIKRITLAFDESRAFFVSPGDSEKNDSSTIHQVREKKFAREQIEAIKRKFEKQIGIPVSMDAYNILVKEKFSSEISDIITRILFAILDNGVVENKEFFLEEAGEIIIRRYTGNRMEKPVTALKKYYGLSQAKTMVRIVGQPILTKTDYILLNLIVDFCQALIKPNITLNKSETLRLKRIAANNVKPVLYKIKAGEMLMREGERVTYAHLQKLKAMKEDGATKEKLILNSIGAAMIIASMLIILYLIIITRHDHTLLHTNKNLLFIGSILLLFMIMSAVSSYISKSLNYDFMIFLSRSSILYGIPLAAGSMIICMFLNINIAIAFALVSSVSITIILNNRFDIFIFFWISSTMGAYWTQKTRKRNVLVKAGVKLGILNVLIVTLLNIYLARSYNFNLLWDWGFAFSGGIMAGIITSGILPLLETIFNYTTDIKLLELANLEQPILKKLMMESPGTYHHCMVVGSMAEAAAFEIGANPLLAKVCGYYHDIGKITKSHYFIENQSDGKNKHDKLAPSMSSLILISHVKDGAEIARENKLGQEIIDVIKQHHGTSLISYFFEKAKKLKGEDAVKIDNFRYPGPKPQTRLAGLIMLADIVEASSKTLNNPTPSRIQGLVQNTINNVFSDGQLDECELTLKDLHNIAKSFNQILIGIHHHRIDYPEKQSANGGKKTSGSIDNKQPKSTPGEPEGNKKKSTGSLKRLGMS